MNVKTALSNAAEIISKSWPDTPFLDASVILQHVLNLSKEQLFSSGSYEIPDNLFSKYKKMTAKRTEGYPVAYITGKKEFYSLVFDVNKNVLIPRPDTEILVENIINEAQGRYKSLLDSSSLKILDLCTGSGCVAAALKHNLVNAEIDASDISFEAALVFKKNCEKYPELSIRFIQSSLFEKIDQKYHIIVTNPPYLKDSDYSAMAEKGWPEPELALNGGKDGLDLIKEIAANAGQHLLKGGMLSIEADPDQMPKIRDILSANSFEAVSTVKDLSGQERVISGYTI